MIMTAGPWRAVRLESYNVRIEDVHVTYELSKDRNSLSGTFMAHSQTKSAVVEFELSLGSDILVKAQAQVGENGTAKANFSLGQFLLPRCVDLRIDSCNRQATVMVPTRIRPAAALLATYKALTGQFRYGQFAYSHKLSQS